MRLLALALFVSLMASPSSAMDEAPECPILEAEKDGVTNDGSDTCDAASYGHLIGQPGDRAEAVGLDQPYRVIPIGAAVTMDFRQNRINFELDENGNIARIYCG